MNRREEARERARRARAGEQVNGVVLNDDGSAIVNVDGQTFMFRSMTLLREEEMEVEERR